MENDGAFVAPEGVYSVTEEHKPPLYVPTPSSTTQLYPTRLSTVTVHFNHAKHASSPGLAQLLGANLNKDLRRDKEREREKDKDKEKQPLDDRSLSSSDTPDDNLTGSPDVTSAQTTTGQDLIVPQEPHHKLFAHPSVSGKKKSSSSKPKHNMRTTSSTFITRMQSVEGLNKILAGKQGEVTFIFYNSGKTFLWYEVGTKAKEPLIRISFSASPTCHDVNTLTASPERLDVVIGFNTGDLVWFDPIANRYGRLNKQGSISSSPCTAVRWVPRSSTLFLVSHADGTIIVYDKERDDGVFSVTIPSTRTSTSYLPQSALHSPQNQLQPASEWDPLTTMYVTVPPWHPEANVNGGARADKGVAKNPVSHWRLSKRAVVDFAFSPDVKHVAAISEDGCLRVIDAFAEELVDCYASYFGALTSVAWSPDGRLILVQYFHHVTIAHLIWRLSQTGGQDDLLTIFSPWEQRVVARCQGHSSFVSAVAFDAPKCDGRTYRFGSVGEDNKLILWDFSSSALHRPKLQHGHHARISMASNVSLAAACRRGTGSTAQLSTPRYHPAPSRNEVSAVQPVLVKHIEADMLSCLTFIPRALLTATKHGHVKMWVRPLVPPGNLRRRAHGRQALSISDLQDVG